MSQLQKVSLDQFDHRFVADLDQLCLSGTLPSTIPIAQRRPIASTILTNAPPPPHVKSSSEGNVGSTLHRIVIPPSEPGHATTQARPTSMQSVFSLFQRTLPLRIVNPSPSGSGPGTGRRWARMMDITTGNDLQTARQDEVETAVLSDACAGSREKTANGLDKPPNQSNPTTSSEAHRILTWKAPPAWGDDKVFSAEKAARYASTVPSQYSLDHESSKTAIASSSTPLEVATNSNTIVSPTFSSQSLGMAALGLLPPPMPVGKSYEITSFIEGTSKPPTTQCRS